MILNAREIRALRSTLAMSSIDWRWFTFSVIFGTLGLGSAIALAAVSAWLIARASQMPPVLTLSVAATSVRAFGIGKALFRYLERITSHQVALAGMTDLRTALYSKLADSPTDRVARLRRGEILSRTGADVDRMGDVVVKSLLPATIAVTSGIIAVIIVGALSPLIGVVLFLALAFSAIAGSLLAGRGARAAEEAHAADQAELAAISLAILEGADELRVSGRLGQMMAEQKRIESRLQAHRDAAAKPTALASAVDIVALGIAVVAALLIGIGQVESGTLSEVALAVCVLTPLAAFEGTAMLGQAAVTLVRGAASANRIDDLLAGTSSRETIEADLDPIVEARDLVVGWPGGPDVAGPLSFTVTPGQSLALVGPSGIGKSTILATLAGLIPPKSGQALIGGQDAYGLSPASVSRVMTLTAEDSHIFHTSVMENLRVARADLTEAEARAALDQAGLGPWLGGLDSGLDHIIGSDGTTVSGGERRRLLLARAYASGAPIIALDEPAEHLDPATADDMTATLLASERGVILVTHRLSALGGADQVIVVGTDEMGTHEDLMTSSDSYRWMVSQEQ